MKLRKNEIISPKSFSFPHWKIKNPYRGNRVLNVFGGGRV